MADDRRRLQAMIDARLREADEYRLREAEEYRYRETPEPWEQIFDGEMDTRSPTFDISLPATHSYMGSMKRVGPSEVVRAGWRGTLPALAAPSVVFVSETVPLRLPKVDADLLDTNDHLFALVYSDDIGMFLSSDGVLCETFERSEGVDGAGGEEGYAGEVTLKARATHRLRVRNVQPHSTPYSLFSRPRKVVVEVLGESGCVDPLQHVRLPSVSALRRSPVGCRSRVIANRMDAALTPWPSFLYDMIDCDRLQTEIKDHFEHTSGMTSIPADPFALSVWAARHSALDSRGRKRLWNTNGIIERLWQTCRLLRCERSQRCARAQSNILCCAACGKDVSDRNVMFAMSSDGAQSHYTNPRGITHDILTVRSVSNVSLSGAPSAEYSWFPGYTWTVIVCTHCDMHLGWRFDTLSPTLRPSMFYGLCRNNLRPPINHDRDHDSDDGSHLRARTDSPPTPAPAHDSSPPDAFDRLFRSYDYN